MRFSRTLILFLILIGLCSGCKNKASVTDDSKQRMVKVEQQLAEIERRLAELEADRRQRLKQMDLKVPPAKFLSLADPEDLRPTPERPSMLDEMMDAPELQLSPEIKLSPRKPVPPLPPDNGGPPPKMDP